MRLGALVEGGRFRSDSRTNYLGTYTFASLADYEAGRPATYTRRIGDPLVEYSHWQAGLFIQDDWRARKNLTVSAGVREELQTHLGDRWNLAPRASLTWSPFGHGRTTVRAGGGIFYDWLDADTFEQTLRVDGVRQQDLVIRNPGYPNPVAGGADQEILPASTYVLSGEPRDAEARDGERRPQPAALDDRGGNVSFSHTEGIDRFRGRNINAPQADGARPDPALGNVTQVESTARMRGDALQRRHQRQHAGAADHGLRELLVIRQSNDADGPFSLPADSYELAGEWGPAAGVPRHLFSGIVNTHAREEHPARRDRDRAHGNAVQRHHRARRQRRHRVHRPSAGRRAQQRRRKGHVGSRRARQLRVRLRPAVRLQRSGRPDDDRAARRRRRRECRGSAGRDRAAAARKTSGSASSCTSSAQNLFNHVNPIGYSGVMTSPFFAQPTAAMPGRRIDSGIRIGF